MIVNLENIDSILQKLSYQTVFVFDTETSGLDILGEDNLCGVGIGIASREVYYFPFRHINDEGNLPLSYLGSLFKILEGKLLIGHNIKFDVKALYKEGFDYSKCELRDTMVMVRLCSLFRDPFFALDKAANDFLGLGRGEYKVEFKKFLRKQKIKRICEASINIVGDYCCKDVLCANDLYLMLEKGIKLTGQEKIWHLDCKVTKVLLNMETKGISVDLDYCAKCVDLLEKKSGKTGEEIYKLVGREFNIDSNPQLDEVLTSIGMVSSIKTKKNNNSWKQAALARFEDNLICKKIIEYRTVNILKRTFFEPILEKNRSVINTSFKNWGTITGRLSCEEPNLQNIPKFIKNISDEKEEKISDSDLEMIQRIVKSGAGGRGWASSTFTGDESLEDESLVSARRLFISREGTSLFSLDLSQMEIVVFLFYVGDKYLLDMISQGKFDFHSWIAVEALGAKRDDPNFNFIREIAKSITFGIIYGMGLETLAIQIGKTREEARDFREKYFERIPKARSFMKMMMERVEKGESIYNVYDRRYVLLPIDSYKIVNYLVQGTAGEIIKERMIEIDTFLQNKTTRMLIQIHDELLLEVPVDEEKYLPNIVNLLSTNSLGIKMGVDVKKCVGNWARKVDYVLQGVGTGN